MNYYDQRTLMQLCDAAIEALYDADQWSPLLITAICEQALANHHYLDQGTQANTAFGNALASNCERHTAGYLMEPIMNLSQQLCSNLPINPADDDEWTDEEEEAHEDHLHQIALTEQYPWNF